MWGVGTLGNHEMGAHRSEEICGRGSLAGKEISGWLLEIAPNLPPSRDSPACTFNLIMDPSVTSSGLFWGKETDGIQKEIHLAIDLTCN